MDSDGDFYDNDSLSPIINERDYFEIPNSGNQGKEEEEYPLSLQEPYTQEENAKCNDDVRGQKQTEETEHSELDLSKLIVRAANLKQEQKYLTTGIKEIDKFLLGGIPTFGVTELVGESSNGKTQLCLQLALTCQLPTSCGGLGAGAVYISTESAFPSSRLAELTTHFTLKYGELVPKNPMDRILIEHIPETAGLLNCINKRLPNLIGRTGNFRLLIIDSVAALFRADYDETTQKQRTVDLRNVGQSLHDICLDFNVAVVVVNQVSASLMYSGNIPALGLAWANMITTRINVARKDDVRSLHIMFAPHIPNTSINFVITQQGVQTQLDTDL